MEAQSAPPMKLGNQMHKCTLCPQAQGSNMRQGRDSIAQRHFATPSDRRLPDHTKTLFTGDSIRTKTLSHKCTLRIRWQAVDSRRVSDDSHKDTLALHGFSYQLLAMKALCICAFGRRSCLTSSTKRTKSLFTSMSPGSLNRTKAHSNNTSKCFCAFTW